MAILRDEDSTLFLIYCWINDRKEVACGYQKVGVDEKDREVGVDRKDREVGRMKRYNLLWIVVFFPLQIVPKDEKRRKAIRGVKNGELVFE